MKVGRLHHSGGSECSHQSHIGDETRQLRSHPHVTLRRAEIMIPINENRQRSNDTRSDEREMHMLYRYPTPTGALTLAQHYVQHTKALRMHRDAVIQDFGALAISRGSNLCRQSSFVSSQLAHEAVPSHSD